MGASAFSTGCRGHEAQATFGALNYFLTSAYSSQLASLLVSLVKNQVLFH